MGFRARRYARIAVPALGGLVAGILANLTPAAYLPLWFAIAGLVAVIYSRLTREPSSRLAVDIPPRVGAAPRGTEGADPGPSPGAPPAADPEPAGTWPTLDYTPRVRPTWTGPTERAPRDRRTGELLFPVGDLSPEEWVAHVAGQVRTTLLVGPDDEVRTDILRDLADELGRVPEPHSGRYDPALDTPDPKVLWLDLALWNQFTRGWLFERALADHGVAEDWLRHWLDDGSVALMVDGLDEIEPGLRDECASMIEGLIAGFPAAVVVLACQHSVYSSRSWTGFDQVAVVRASIMGGTSHGIPGCAIVPPPPVPSGVAPPVLGAPPPSAGPPWTAEEREHQGSDPIRWRGRPAPDGRHRSGEPDRPAPPPPVGAHPTPRYRFKLPRPVNDVDGSRPYNFGPSPLVPSELPRDQRRIVDAMSGGRGYDLTQLASAARVVPSALPEALNALIDAGLVAEDHIYGGTRYRLAYPDEPR